MPSVINMLLFPSLLTNPNVSFAVASSPNKSHPFGSTPTHAATTTTSETDVLLVKCTVAFLHPFSTKGTTSLISQFVSIDNQSVSNRTFTTDVKHASKSSFWLFSFSSTLSLSSSSSSSLSISTTSPSFLFIFTSIASFSSSKMSSKCKDALMRLNQSGPAEDVFARNVAPNAPRRRGYEIFSSNVNCFSVVASFSFLMLVVVSSFSPRWRLWLSPLSFLFTLFTRASSISPRILRRAVSRLARLCSNKNALASRSNKASPIDSCFTTHTTCIRFKASIIIRRRRW